jgi:uncharacterized protein
MIIDSHCHLKHGNKERTEYTPESIVQIMDETGIDKTIVFAMCDSSSRAIEMAHQAHQAFPDRLIPYAYALPHIAESALDHVEHAIANLGFPGIKIHGGEVRLADYIIDPIFDLAAKHNVPCLVDFVGKADDCQRIAERFPKATIIVAHFGQYLSTNRDLIDRFITLAEKHENLILDTSGVVLSWKIPQAIQKIGSDRVTFGIDGPHPYPTLANYATDEIAKIQNLSITERDKENLFSNTISRLLKLD